MSDLPHGTEFDDACAVIIDAIESTPPLYQLQRDLEKWYLQSRADGYPSRASGAEPGHGRTNITHDFGDDEHPEELSVAVPSDPTGELVARRDDDPVYDALVVAWSEIQAAKAAIVNARSRIVRALQPADELEGVPETARSEQWCWSCLRLVLDGGIRHHENVYRVRTRNDGTRVPLCRRCYDWALYHDDELPLLGVIEVWAKGEKLTTKRLDAIEAAQVPKPKHRHRVA